MWWRVWPGCEFPGGKARMRWRWVKPEVTGPEFFLMDHPLQSDFVPKPSVCY